MSSLPSFEFYPADFLVGTAEMTIEEVGAYIRLLCYQWAKDALPDDDKRLAQLAGCTGTAVAAVRYKFSKGDDGLLRNLRLEAERQKRAEFSSKQTKKAVHRWRIPQSEEAKRIAAIYRRNENTEWTEKEIAAFKKLQPIDKAELLLVEAYYRVNRNIENSICRRDLGTFLNNYRGEVDRAKAWCAKNPKKAAMRATIDDSEPKGFRAWYETTYPEMDAVNRARAWPQIPDYVKAEFRRALK